MSTDRPLQITQVDLESFEARMRWARAVRRGEVPATREEMGVAKALTFAETYSAGPAKFAQIAREKSK